MQIQLPLPAKLDPTVTMMTVEEKPDITYRYLQILLDELSTYRAILHPGHWLAHLCGVLEMMSVSQLAAMLETANACVPG